MQVSLTPTIVVEAQLRWVASLNVIIKFFNGDIIATTTTKTKMEDIIPVTSLLPATIARLIAIIIDIK